MDNNPYASPQHADDGPETPGAEGRSPAVPRRGMLSFEFPHKGHHVLLYVTAFCKGVVQVDGETVFEERSFKFRDIIDIEVAGDAIRFDARSNLFGVKTDIYINGELVYEDATRPGKKRPNPAAGIIGGIVGGVAGYFVARYAVAWLLGN